MPKAVKRVHEIYEKPVFMKDVNGGDVKQGSLGDCWIMASFTALANVQNGINRICVAHDASKLNLASEPHCILTDRQKSAFTASSSTGMENGSTPSLTTSFI